MAQKRQGYAAPWQFDFLAKIDPSAKEIIFDVGASNAVLSFVRFIAKQKADPVWYPGRPFYYL